MQHAAVRERLQSVRERLHTHAHTCMPQCKSGLSPGLRLDLELMVRAVLRVSLSERICNHEGRNQNKLRLKILSQSRRKPVLPGSVPLVLHSLMALVGSRCLPCCSLRLRLCVFWCVCVRVCGTGFILIVPEAKVEHEVLSPIADLAYHVCED